MQRVSVCKEVMTKSIVTLESSGPVKKATELIDKHDIGCLIVVDKGEPVGIVTKAGYA